MAKAKEPEKRVAALEASVRELRNRLDDIVTHLNVTQDPQIARVLERYPDLRAHLPRLG